MTTPKLALLPDRGIVSVTGPDAEKLLQGLITNDMDALGDVPAIHAGLLSPQGKILFEFFVVRVSDGFLLDTARAHADALAKRLTLYKLRADATIKNCSSDFTVTAVWDASSPLDIPAADAVTYPDPRQHALGHRILVTLRSDWIPAELGAETATQIDYNAHRIGVGVPEAGADYELGDTFVHEALFDQLRGVSFKKGCYVGQEVVSRMQHRGTARKRIVPVNAEEALPASGTPVTAGGVKIGVLGSVAGNRALTLIRLDRAAEAISKGQAIEADDSPLTIDIPEWATFSLPESGTSGSNGRDSPSST